MKPVMQGVEYTLAASLGIAIGSGFMGVDTGQSAGIWVVTLLTMGAWYVIKQARASRQ